MAYTNSPLVDYVCISPNRTKNRNHAIDTISIHCVVGQCTVKTLGNVFASPKRQASSNYGIGFDGQIGMYCEEKDRSWCTSSASNDNRAITIEVASDTKEPYAVTEAAYNSLIDLVTDICKRNGIKELKWKNDKSLIGNVAAQNMTVHKWFANKSCPGTFLYKRHSQIAAEVNKRLCVGTTTTKVNKPTAVTLAFNKGDIVQFKGGKHYKFSSSLTGTSVKACKARITAISTNSKHPYHLRAVNDAGAFTGGVYGWVDANTISAIKTTTKPVPPAVTTNTAKIKKGNIVSIMKGAKYYSGAAVPTWVVNKTWIVKENPVGDRVIIDKSSDGKNAICSAISSRYLSVVSGKGTTTTPVITKPITTAVIKKGSKVKVRNGAKTYTGGKLAPFVYKTTYTVLEPPKGNRVVIGLNGTVTAAVNKKDIILV